jgi:hypothetical protein
MRSATALLIVPGIALLSVTAPVYAQQQATPPDQARTVDVDRLPLNLNRIQRQLRHAADLEQRDGLNLRYVIQIYGTAPPLQFFTEESNLVNGPVPYGAPTHRELIDHVTPQQFRAPVADFSALIRWLADRDKNKEKGKR